MSAHRYWRVVTPPQSPSNGTQLTTLELRSAIGGADLAPTAAKTGVPNVPTNWFDSNDTTDSYAITSSSGGACFVNFDFGTPVEILQLRIRSGSNGNLAPKFVQLWHSDNGVDWAYTSLDFDGQLMGANTAVLLSGWTFGGLPVAKVQAASAKIQGAATPLSTPRAAPRHTFVRDVYYGGLGRITGTVKEKSTPSNVPLARRVRLFRERDGHFIRETFSDAVTGAYAFENIDATVKYTVVAYDYTNNYRAVIGDNLTPDPMP